MSHRDELISTVKELLGSGTYNSYVFREPSVVEMTFHTPVKVLNKLVEVKEFLFIGEKDIRCICVMPFSVKEESKRPLAAEYLSRVNWYMRTGWFSMDHSDGEVRANAERIHTDSLPTAEDFKTLVMTPVSLASQYMSGLILTIQGVGSPKENAERFTPDALKST